MKPAQRNSVVVIGIVIVAIIGGIGIFMSTQQKKPAPNELKESTLTDNVVIPTVDPSVGVELESQNDGKDLILTISTIPNGTEMIEYEMSYETAKQGLQGLIGTLTIDEGIEDIEKEVTAGTCSSGTCVYHDITSDVDVILKFSGTYGDRIFEKAYSIDQ